MLFVFFFSSRRRHTRWPRDWSSDVCSSDLRRAAQAAAPVRPAGARRRLAALGRTRWESPGRADRLVRPPPSLDIVTSHDAADLDATVKACGQAARDAAPS